MSLIFVVLHIIVCLALIMIVLLQTGKGADMGAAFGGGASQTLFGATGASTFLSKMTTAAAILFMVTSLTLAYMATKQSGSKSILSDQPAVQAPVEGTPSPGSEEGTTTEEPMATEQQTSAAPTADTETTGQPEEPKKESTE